VLAAERPAKNRGKTSTVAANSSTIVILSCYLAIAQVERFRQAASAPMRTQARQSSSIAVEKVARGPHGLDQVALSARRERLAQMRDMRVHGSGVNGIAIPYGVDEFLTRNDQLGIPQQMTQHRELDRGCVDAASPASHPVRAQICCQIGESRLL
jgi:hypothetical protein